MKNKPIFIILTMLSLSSLYLYIDGDGNFYLILSLFCLFGAGLHFLESICDVLAGEIGRRKSCDRCNEKAEELRDILNKLNEQDES